MASSCAGRRVWGCSHPLPALLQDAQGCARLHANCGEGMQNARWDTQQEDLVPQVFVAQDFRQRLAGFSSRTSWGIT